MTVRINVSMTVSLSIIVVIHTNQTQPDKLKAEDSHETQGDPAHGLRVQRKPEEAFIRRIDLPGIWVCTLENPVAVARLGVDFVPPAQADEASSGDVFQVVKVYCQQDDGDDEDEDIVAGEEETEEVHEEGSWVDCVSCTSTQGGGKGREAHQCGIRGSRAE